MNRESSSWRTTPTSPACCAARSGMEGYEVRIAGDGEAALDEAAVFEPDAVVLDLGLPGLDGVEVSRRLREGGDVPILILTARDVARLPRRGPRLRRRRLPGQAVRARGAAGPPARAPAPPAAARQRLPGQRRPAPEPRHARGRSAATARSTSPPRVRAARVHDAQRAAGGLAPEPARRRLGLPPVRRDQHGRRVRLQPAPQARGGRRAARAAHRARRRLRAEAG